MAKRKLHVLIGLFIGLSMYGQDVFKVMASKGNTQNKEGKKLVMGMKLSQNDIIKVNPNDYLGLIHLASGKTLELKTPGSYSIKDLSAKASHTSGSYSQKYADYVLNAMSSSGGATNNAVGGVVYRATYDVTVDFPTSDHKVLLTEKVVNLSWHKHPKITVYEIVVQNMFDEVVAKHETKDTTYKIDLTKVDLGEENQVKIKVKAKNEGERKLPQDKEINFVFTDSKELNKEKETVLSELKEETSVNYLVKAKFYESKDMFLDAVKCYDKAIALEPKVEEFKLLKKNYLTTVGAISEEESK